MRPRCGAALLNEAMDALKSKWPKHGGSNTILRHPGQAPSLQATPSGEAQVGPCTSLHICLHICLHISAEIIPTSPLIARAVVAKADAQWVEVMTALGGWTIGPVTPIYFYRNFQ
eukprot:3591719-Pyramimonas_sp.AAC.1